VSTPGLAPAPTEVELISAEAILKVGWDDGHQSVFALTYIRGFCPCAECQGHSAGDWTYITTESAPVLVGIEEVGNYAISLRWQDGHETGIYSWEVLRELCPCDACQQLQGEKHAIHQMPATH